VPDIAEFAAVARASTTAPHNNQFQRC